ncbi:uncharacterized protein [Montipora foliosa]|uniref:uncharacterized protein n=1 Tax=Montipora foliosa TaxID=591990 RepID=UPI0035F174D0
MGGATTAEVKQKKIETIDIFSQAAFHLHKRHSNAKALEDDPTADCEDDLSYAKQQLGVKPRECGLLGLKWDKSTDDFGITFPVDASSPTKRGILGKVAKIYDPLGLVAPITLQGKLLYRDARDKKCACDAPPPPTLTRQWKKWENSLPQRINCPRSLTPIRESIEGFKLHAFGDASGRGVAAVVYAVVTHSSSESQGLVTVKARLAKQGLTIPRRELVSGHMAVNLITNALDAIQGFPVTSLHCWLDSTVALHWIRGNGDYKKFVANRVRKIRDHNNVTWRHVPTNDNPVDYASRGGMLTEGNQLWWKGPTWLADPTNWPADIVTTPTTESNAEVKPTKELFALAVDANDELDDLLSKTSYWRTLRVCAWIRRFIDNAKKSKPQRINGPLTTEEIKNQELFWVRRVQARGAKGVEGDRLTLNLQKNDDGLLECRGRLQGDYPVYRPDSTILAEKIVQQAHNAKLHGGVGFTMARIREQFWIPRLRRLVKRTVKKCYGCKGFQAVALAKPPQAFYQKREQRQLVLTTALYLEVLPNLETETFLRSLKRLIARHGRPSVVYSDNGRTFIGAEKWLKKLQRDEQLQGYLAAEKILWRFNLSRAPWWGGQLEHLVGLFKSAFYKTVGGGMLSWFELCDVVLEVETQLNRRPLSYVEDDVQLPLITPASFLFSKSNLLPEQEPWREADADLRKRACKDALWKRWTREYLTALRERHNLNLKGQTTSLKVGDVVIIRSEDKNRGEVAGRKDTSREANSAFIPSGTYM